MKNFKVGTYATVLQNKGSIAHGIKVGSTVEIIETFEGAGNYRVKVKGPSSHNGLEIIQVILNKELEQIGVENEDENTDLSFDELIAELKSTLDDANGLFYDDHGTDDVRVNEALNIAVEQLKYIRKYASENAY